MFQGGSLWAGLVTGTMSQVKDTKHLQKGLISSTEYAVQTAENVTGAVGVMAGVQYGGQIGTAVFPVVGTVVGSVVGGVLGNRLGRTVGTQAGHRMFQNKSGNGAMDAVAEES